MAGRGIVVDASEAEALMREIAAKRAVLLPEVRAITRAAAGRMQQTASGLAASKSMPGLAGSIGVRAKDYGTGTECTVEARSPFGYIREYGAGRSGPHPFMLPALERHQDAWETALLDAASRVLD